MQGEFRKSIVGGFNRHDVLGYIDNISQQAKQAQEMLQGQLDEITAARDELTKKIEAFEEKVSGLEQQLEQEQTKAEEAERQNEQLQQQVNDKQRALLDRESEIFKKSAQNRQLEQRVSQLEKTEQKYNSISNEIGKMMLDAKVSAENIVSKAEEKSGRISQSTDEAVNAITQEIEVFRGEIDEIRDGIRQTVAAIEQRMDSIYESLDRALSTLGSMKTRQATHLTRPVSTPVEPQGIASSDFFR